MRPLRENATSTRCAWIRTPLLQDFTRNVDLWGTEENKELQHFRFSSQALAYTRKMLTPHARCDYFYEHLFESFWSPGETDRPSARSTQLLVPKPRLFTRLACVPPRAVCCSYARTPATSEAKSYFTRRLPLRQTGRKASRTDATSHELTTYAK